ncbi:MAG: PD-(D/E)XK nuclease family protein, partial [Paracoccaceae bacterium]
KGLLRDGENIEAVINEALRVLDDDSLSFIFAPDTLAEVAISARLGPLENRLMNGIIDRLIINGKDVWVIDFKTNRSVPSDMKEVPEGILRQMGAYTAALADLYPEHQIKPCILWTAKPLLMPLEPELAINALRSVADA